MLRAPRLEAPLHGPQKAVGIAIGMLALQLIEELAARPPRFLVEPHLQLLGHRCEWVGAPPSAFRSGFRLRSGPHLARLPRRPQRGEEGFERGGFGGRAGRVGDVDQPLLVRPYVAQKKERIQGRKDRLEPIADCVWRSRVRQQPLAGGGLPQPPGRPVADLVNAAPLIGRGGD